MISLFRKKDDTPSPAGGEDPASDENTSTPKGFTPPKGRRTPRREESEPLTGRAYVAPKDNKEARKRAKELRRTQRSAEMEGMRKGDERFLLGRDKGPVRRLVRDVVDARRNAGTWFFGGTLVVFVGSLRFMPPEIRLATTTLWGVLVVVFLADAILLSLRIRRMLREKFPDEGKTIRHCFYGVMRSVVFRRMRTPAPMVKIGDRIA